MRQRDFEQRVLKLWMTTQIPLTRPNIQYYTGADRSKMDRWLDDMVADDVLTIEIEGEDLEWRVMGSQRSTSGPRTFDELERLDKARGAVKDVKDAASSLSVATTLMKRPKEGFKELVRTGEGEKSLVASGLLSLFLGPIGWLYAGAWREAIPAAILFVVLYNILPGIILAPLLGIGMPASAIVGLLYAWRYNRTGDRQPMLPEDP